MTNRKTSISVEMYILFPPRFASKGNTTHTQKMFFFYSKKREREREKYITVGISCFLFFLDCWKNSDRSKLI